ncbi:MAG: DUF4097 family beta strand repeat-containing protein [Candidatus Fermentibacteria bacterium]|nr:DUF4097 family beta strand repeat-containing protein [Candidatus Fermentibacteria bacterium]
MKHKIFVLALALLTVSCVIIRLDADLISVRTSEFDMKHGSLLSFSNSRGDLEVTEWESDYILIEASIYGDSGIGVPEGLEILFEQTDDHLISSVTYPGRTFFGSVDLSVKIPFDMGYAIEYSSTNGETLIKGDVTASVESTNGDIYVEVSSAQSILTTNGDITALLLMQEDVVTIETTNGDITVELPDHMGFEVETTNGDISVDGYEISNEASYDGQWTARIETTNGDVTISRTGDSGEDDYAIR